MVAYFWAFLDKVLKLIQLVEEELIAVKNGGDENERDGFRTTNVCQMGCFILHEANAKDAFSQEDYGLLGFHSQDSSGRRRYMHDVWFLNKASNKVALRVLHVVSHLIS